MLLKRLPLALFAAGLFINASAANVPLPKGVTLGPSAEGITEYHLPNGLKVLLFPDASRPTITVNVTYLVGSRHENYGETGMAHLLEHMMFKGASKNRDITQQFSQRGMQFNGTTSLDRTNYYEVFQATGDNLLEHMMFKGASKNTDITQQFSQRGMQFNGTTSLDRTNYYEVFQATGDNLPWALQMEADRMTHSFIARKDLDSEMTVVRNEYESGENSPSSVLMKRMQSVAYDWHSYGRSTIGNRSDIENVGIPNLQAFYRTYYQPDNAVLLVAGKFDPATTLATISRQFGAIPKPTRTLPVFWTVEPTQDGERTFAVRRAGDTQEIMLGYKIPSGLHDDTDLLNFASDILASAPAGRLHKQLVETGMASEVFGFGQTGYAPGLQYFGAVVKKDAPMEPVRVALTKAVESFVKEPPTPEEMERVRRTYLNDYERALNDPQRVGVSLSEAIALGDWRLFFVGRERVRTITSTEVAAAAGRYFKRDNRVTGTFIPDAAPERALVPPAPTVASLLKTYKPAAASLSSEDFEPSQENILKRTTLTTAGGVQLALLPKKNRGEMVSVDLRQHIGDEKNLFGKGAVYGLTAAMLTRGTSKYTREQLSDEFQRLKISGGLSHFDTTRANLPEALKLIAHVLREANFPAAEFEQLRQQSLVSLEGSRNEPEAVAQRALGRHFNIYPRGDIREETTLEQDIADIQAVKLADLQAFHKAYYGASPAQLAIVGDFDAKAIVPLVDQLFGNWKPEQNVAPVLSRYADVAPFKTMIDTPDKENGVYAARINLDLNMDDPDYPALMLANFIFGDGGLRSRLMDRIRQKDGLSYGGGSNIAPGDMDRAGSFTINAIAAPQNLKRLDAAVTEELSRARKDGFTAAELANAKSGLMQQRVQTRADDGALAAGWTTYLYQGRTYAWSAAFEKKLMAVNLEQLNAAFRKAIDPAKLSVVMAGDTKKVTPK